MNIRHKIYLNSEFKKWKKKVASHIPHLAIGIYQAKLKGIHIEAENEKLLGSVIKDINDPFYSILGLDGERLNEENRMSFEILLELNVERLFKFVRKTLKRRYIMKR